MRTADVIVLGAGMVGVSAALHLQARGRQVALVDRNAGTVDHSFQLGRRVGIDRRAGADQPLVAEERTAEGTHEEMIGIWRLTIAPTLLFFGPGAREVAERMEGGYLPDFYRAYLEQRLEVARANL